MKSSRPIHERIMERVCQMPMSEGGCHLWTGATTRDGYGVIWFQGKTQYVHRLMASHFGMPPGDRTVDHICRVRNCVRHSHMVLCSAEENAERARSDAWLRLTREFMASQMEQEAA